jgi:hypothetical protein
MIVKPRIVGVADSHPAVQGAIAELLTDLRDVPELTAEERSRASEGSKGALSELVLAVGASGAIPGLIRIFHLWLGRDRDRSLTLMRQYGDKPVEVIHISGNDISAAAVQDALSQLMKNDPRSPS